MRNTHGARFCNTPLSGAALLHGGCHSFEDWGIVPKQPLHVPAAKDATPSVTIRGAVNETTLRLTGLTGGDPVFATIKDSWEFMVRRQHHWVILRDKIVNYLQGKEIRVVLDDDRAHFYRGSVSVNDFAPTEGRSKLTLDYEFEPYKYELATSLEPWLWSPFRFPDGVIRDYKSMTVNGTLALKVIGSPMPVVPTFISTGTVSVTFAGVTTPLTAGVRTAIPSVVIREGTQTITFTGSGTVSVDYRGGRL